MSVNLSHAGASTLRRVAHCCLNLLKTHYLITEVGGPDPSAWLQPEARNETGMSFFLCEITRAVMVLIPFGRELKLEN